MTQASDTNTSQPAGTPPRRFLQVFNQYLHPGGEEKSVARIAEHLNRHGYHVERFWRHSNEWQGTGAPPKWKQPLLLWENPTLLQELKRYHEMFRPSAWILHNVLPVISLAVYRLAYKLDVPIIQWLHNYRPLSPGGSLMAGRRLLAPEDPRLTLKEILAGSWRGRLLTAWLALGYARLRRQNAFSAVKAWIAISESMRDLFIRGGFPPTRVFALRHAWDIRPPCASPEAGTYFLFLGRLTRTKGIHFLIDLWHNPKLRQIPLYIAGQGPEADSLKAKAPASVHWLGHIDGEEKRRLIAGARALLAPGIWPEPLGLIIYEAYEQHTPVIASTVGGMTELVQHDKTGFLLPAADQAAWRQAILSLHQVPARALEMGQAGRRWLEQNASYATWTQQFDTIIHQTISQ